MIFKPVYLIKILVPVFTQIRNYAGLATWFAGDTGIAPVQYQPVMGVLFEFIRYQAQQVLLDFSHILAGCDSGPVGYPEDMGVDGNGWMAEGRVEYDIGCFTTHTGQCFQCCTVFRDLAGMLLFKDSAGFHNVFCLGIEKPDGLYMVLEASLTQLEHGVRGLYFFEECPGGLVDADIRGLRGKNDGNQ